jgi:serine/threonine protein kinase
MGIEGLLAGYLLCERYRVDAVIGRGGMGIVYRARDTRLDRDVAVKVITAASAELSARARLRDRFHREARAIARLQHPNVVSVFDFGTDARLDLDFLVMEMLRGEDLAARLARSARLSARLSGEILLQAARGLAAGHEAGIIHRDVKPGNLFLANVGAGRTRVAVLDFGIVQLAADHDGAETATHLTAFGRAPHSPAYAAPEQLVGSSGLTPACDVWALAVTGFQMLTGEKPYADADHALLLRGSRRDSPSVRQRNPAVSRPLDEVLRTALAVDAADRFRDARSFCRALEHALSGAAAAPDEGWIPTPSRYADASHEETTLVDTSRANAHARGPWRSPFHPPNGEPAGHLRATQVDLTLVAGPAGPIIEPEPGIPESAVAATPPSGAHAPRFGLVRRVCVATWSLLVTAAASGLAIAFGYAFFLAYDQAETEPFYASMVGLTIAIPWALHRILGRRGSLLFALLASALTGFAVYRFVTPLAGLDATVLLLPVAQLVCSAWLLRLTRGRDPAVALAESVSL